MRALLSLPGRGFAVGEFMLEDIQDAIEIREVLEGTAARLVAERLTSPGELKNLRAYCRAMEALRSRVPHWSGFRSRSGRVLIPRATEPRASAIGNEKGLWLITQVAGKRY
jgi:DNA-binding GntR family transcriptional regulator